MKKEHRTKKELQCIRNAHYADFLDNDGNPVLDDEGNKIKVFKEALYREVQVDFTAYIVEKDGELHEFLDEESAKCFIKDCK